MGIKRLWGVFWVVVMTCFFCAVPCEGGGKRVEYAQAKEQVVYICTGGYATKYHRYKSCKGLGNYKGEIKAVPMSTATSQGRTACKICYR